MKTLKLNSKKVKRKRKQETVIKKLEADKISDEIAAKKAADEKLVTEKSTVSIAVPGSILENAQSFELKTYLAGQIARAACIFRIDEVVIFDDICSSIKNKKTLLEDGSQVVRHSCIQLARILQYLECPQYLRKFLFPLHKDLQYSGLLNPLDAPHHLRLHNTFMYREGVITEKKAKEGACSSYVNVGLLNDVKVNKSLPAGVRVTVKLEDSYASKKKKIKGEIVSPNEPRFRTGVYWGYNVRIAHSFSEIFTKSPYKEGYNLTVGTSDTGSNIYQIPTNSLNYDHALIVFGGLKGLEAAVQSDSKLDDVKEPKLLFDYYINSIPTQGSRTIRTEEAILITLGILKEKLNPVAPDITFTHSDKVAASTDTGTIVINENTSLIDMSKFD
ncbi:putative methyltransferase C9orf114 homolog [Condylostylus longicornis]|uniref:putative methyltransferase C9orf114 homolog n=1 Tax=Condylostylus longicornis TaxID=2530218 RepID=UPI00244DC7CF|nr:putative methyltransferase C9orf114 homolog [Condylostylus longicornis]